MHEGNFTGQIVTAVLHELGLAPAGRPRRIKVKVGELFHLEPESVRAHFRSLSAGTRLEGAVLELEEVRLRLRCRDCGWEGAAEDHHYLFCSACDSRAVDTLAGDAVTVEAIELEG